MAILSHSIYWKSKKIYSTPIGTIGLANNLQQKNVIPQLQERAEAKLAQMEQAGICGVVGRNSSEEVARISRSHSQHDQGGVEVIKSKRQQLLYQGMLFNVLYEDGMQCNFETRDGQRGSNSSHGYAGFLQVTNVKKVTREFVGGMVKLTIDVEIDQGKMKRRKRSYTFKHASITVLSLPQVTTPQRITIQIGERHIVSSGSWADPSYRKNALIVDQTIDCH